MEKVCKNCKWWAERRSARFYRECLCEKLCEDGHEDGGDDSLVYSYMEGGSFHPGPLFGCVHWEKRG